jgi:8-oxo-dGTP pyrophosphatase MutT (NUDIX family)
VTSANQPLTRPVLPKLAASLIVFDDTTQGIHLLMGQRHLALKFMPGFFVFPGGRVDPVDHATPLLGILPQQDDAAYRARLTKRHGAVGLAPLAAAVREAREETGLVFHQNDGSLDAGCFHYLGRAVTPAHMPRRFDTHFFMVARHHIVSALPDPTGPDSELTSMQWLKPEDTFDKPKAGITDLVIKLAKEQIAGILRRAPERQFGHWLRH